MFPSFLVFHVVVVLTVASASIQDTSPSTLGEQRAKGNPGALSLLASVNNNPSPVNKTYRNKEENPLRVPHKFYEERKKKNKITKSPKRTIQKIIKNGKSRSRKIYVHPVTRQPIKTSVNIEISDSTLRSIEERVPTERSYKKRPKKSSKFARYPMPFNKFHAKNLIAHKRNRRDINRDDVFIIKDLDEMEFLSKDKDYDIVKAHVKNYW